MKIATTVCDGTTKVEVIDPSDGAVTHFASVAEGEQIIVMVPRAESPADIEFGEVEAIPEPETEPADAPEDVVGDNGESSVDDPEPEEKSGTFTAKPSRVSAKAAEEADTP